MSDRTRRSARVVNDTISSIDSEKIKDQAAEVAALVGDAGTKAQTTAAQLADQAKEWGQPKVEAFVEWLTPRLEKAWQDSLQAAAPRVEKAAEKASPAIDTAHDKLVEEVLPKIVASFNAAAAAAAEAASRNAEAAAAATVASAASAEQLSRKATKKAAKAAKKHLDATAASAKKAAKAAPAKITAAAEKADPQKKSKTLWWVVGGVTAAGGAYVLWRRAQPTTDPWAEPWDQVPASSFEDARAAVNNAAEAVGEAAGAAVAKGRETGGKVQEAVTDAGEKITGKVQEAVSDAKEATRKATSRSKDAAPSGDEGDATTDGKKPTA
ncbi:hypothetical protein ACFVQ3_03310 [Oerskovia sp. NPDC057915]|uniref:hypothetical protein n=1 Tax=Oerskovia sp. NPDC057915 TaxID=3346280 RepID=UPI0036DABC9F